MLSCFLLLLCYKFHVFNAISEDTDRTPLFVSSDLGLHCCQLCFERGSLDQNG